MMVCCLLPISFTIFTSEISRYGVTPTVLIRIAKQNESMGVGEEVPEARQRGRPPTY